jgi:hypothetical protein
MTTSDERRWTDRDLLLSWQLGAEYVRGGETYAEAYDDAAHANISTPRLSHEERVAQRVHEMERNAEAVREQIDAGNGQNPWRCSP